MVARRLFIKPTFEETYFTLQRLQRLKRSPFPICSPPSVSDIALFFISAARLFTMTNHHEQQDGKQQSQQHKQIGKLPILEKFNILMNSTRNYSELVEKAVAASIISKLEKDIIENQFGSEKEQLAAFYLLLSSKQCPAKNILAILSNTTNESLVNLLDCPDEQRNNTSSSSDSDNVYERLSPGEKGKWNSLQQLITANIDRLSSHTRNLGLVLCFATGTGLISGKDREFIANSSQLEIDQLKKLYMTISTKDEDAYDKLLKVLRMTSNNWALDVLQIKDESDI